MADQQGKLHKQRRIGWFMGTSWHARHVHVDVRARTLHWRGPESPAHDRKSLSLHGAVVAASPDIDARIKRKFVIEVTAAGETVTFAADNEEERRRWAVAMMDAARGAPTAVGSSSDNSSGGSLPSSVVSGATSGEPASDLPTAVYIDGQPTHSSELRVRLPRMADQRCLEPLGIQWFRLPASAAAKAGALCGGPSSSAGSSLEPTDFTQLFPDAKSIPGATAESLTLSPAGGPDTGKVMAVVVRSTSGPGTRWSVCARPVGDPVPYPALGPDGQVAAASDSAAATEGGEPDSGAVVSASDMTTAAVVDPSTSPQVLLAVQPHEHSKYCDRRVRVCTAPGKYREGAIVRASFIQQGASGSGSPTPSVPAGYALAWYRSDVVDTSQLEPPPGDATGGGVPSAAATAPVIGGADSLATAAWSRALHAGTVSSDATSLAATLGDIVYRRVLPRPVADLPPAPPDHVPSTPLPELQARLAVLAQPAPAPQPQQVMSGPESSAAGDYPLFAQDVGRMLVGALIPTGSIAPDTLRPHQRFRRRPDAGPSSGSGGSGGSPSRPASFSNGFTPTAPSTPHRGSRANSVASDGSAGTPGGGVASEAATQQVTNSLLFASLASGVEPSLAASGSQGEAAPASGGGSGGTTNPLAQQGSPKPAMALAGASSYSGSDETVVVANVGLASPASGLSFGDASAGVHEAARSPAPPTQPRPPARAKAASALSQLAASAPSNGGVIVVSPPVGTVEAAPPKARELWIEGPPTVGSLLVGRMYYYGGFEGRCEISWTAINDDGETVELKPPTPAAPLPSSSSGGAEAGAGASIGDDHPRALRLTSAHAGCLIKFRVTPVRSDGDRGHTESSRPTPEVAST